MGKHDPQLYLMACTCAGTIDRETDGRLKLFARKDAVMPRRHAALSLPFTLSLCRGFSYNSFRSGKRWSVIPASVSGLDAHCATLRRKRDVDA